MTKLVCLCLLMITLFGIATPTKAQIVMDNEEQESYMHCTTYTSQSCMDQCERSHNVCPFYMNPDGSYANSESHCDALYAECREGCERQRCYLVI